MHKLAKNINPIVIMLLSIQLASCGTILYPERRNQSAGRVDVGVALLDGLWLLFGIIPGVIAFAVDFSTGAIYIPRSELGGLDFNEYRTVRFDPQTTTQAELEALISKETGQKVNFADRRLELTRVRKGEELPAQLAALDL